MKSLIFALFLLCLFTLGATPIHAVETIDLSAAKYTSCDSFGFCRTQADINELPLSKDGKDTIKAITHDTPFVLDASSTIQNFNISVNENRDKLIISGKVLQDTYWTAQIGEVLIDPWWNVSSNTSSLAYDSPYSGAMSNFTWTGTWSNGVMIHTNESFTWDNLTSSDTSPQLRFCYLWTSGGMLLTNHSWVGRTCVINYTLSANTSYYYTSLGELDGGGEKGEYSQAITPPLYASTFTIEAGSYHDGSTFHNESTPRIYNLDLVYITKTETVSTWYENYLYLNGNSSNTTIFDNTTFNVTGTTNLTNGIVSLYINGTLSANDTTNATNTTNLSTGLYNITGWFGNASTNETITYWLNVTATPVTPSGVVGAVYCTDNSTLAHINVTNLQTDNVITYYEWCAQGCDNVTFSCEPLEYQQNLGNMAIALSLFTAVMLFGWFMSKERRRR